MSDCCIRNSARRRGTCPSSALPRYSRHVSRVIFSIARVAHTIVYLLHFCSPRFSASQHNSWGRCGQRRLVKWMVIWDAQPRSTRCKRTSFPSIHAVYQGIHHIHSSHGCCHDRKLFEKVLRRRGVDGIAWWYRCMSGGG